MHNSIKDFLEKHELISQGFVRNGLSYLYINMPAKPSSKQLEKDEEL